MKVLILLCALLTGNAMAQFPDMRGGDITSRRHCELNHVRYACVTIKKGDNSYVIYYDDKGEYAVYLVDEVKENILLWSRRMM